MWQSKKGWRKQKKKESHSERPKNQNTLNDYILTVWAAGVGRSGNIVNCILELLLPSQEKTTLHCFQPTDSSVLWLPPPEGQQQSLALFGARLPRRSGETCFCSVSRLVSPGARAGSFSCSLATWLSCRLSAKGITWRTRPGRKRKKNRRAPSSVEQIA